MKYPIYTTKELGYLLPVHDIRINKMQLRVAHKWINIGQPPAGQIIYYDNLMPKPKQHFRKMTTNKARAASDDRFHEWKSLNKVDVRDLIFH